MIIDKCMAPVVIITQPLGDDLFSSPDMVQSKSLDQKLETMTTNVEYVINFEVNIRKTFSYQFTSINLCY